MNNNGFGNQLGQRFTMNELYSESKKYNPFLVLAIRSEWDHLHIFNLNLKYIINPIIGLSEHTNCEKCNYNLVIPIVSQ